MAELFSLTKEQSHTLYTAALLHDITKEKSPDEHITLCRVYQIEYTQTDIITPALFHAKTGARLARELFPLECNSEVSQIIETHTTGCVGMNLLQKLLFLADGTEKTRTHETLRELRDYFYKNPEENELYIHLDNTLIKYFDITISYLLKTNQVIDTQTLNARNDLIIKRGNHG